MLNKWYNFLLSCILLLLCPSLAQTQDCLFSNLSATQFGCDENGQSHVVYQFEAAGTQELGYDVFLDGAYFGFFAYGQENPVLENVSQWVSGDELTIRLCENDNPDCCTETTITWDDCQEGCMEFGLFEKNNYGANLGLQPFSTIYYESYTELEVDSFYYNQAHFFENLFVVQDPVDDFFPAASSPFIHLVNMGAHFIFTDYEQAVASVRIDYFEGGAIEPDVPTIWSVNVNDQVQVSFADFVAGSYTLADGVVMQIVPDANTDGQGQLVFEGDIERLYIGSNHLFLDNLCVEPGCGLNVAEFYQQPCNDVGEYQILVDIPAVYLNEDTQYEVSANGATLDVLQQEDYPFLIGPFEFTDAFSITLLDLNVVPGTDTCILSTTFVPAGCDLFCDDFTIEILDISCAAPYITTIEFSVGTIIPNEYFRVRRNGNTLAEYAYGSDTYTLEVLSDSPTFTLEFSDDSNDCAYTIDLTNPCIPEDCAIENLTATATDCVDGQYSVILDFEYDGTFTEGFTYAYRNTDGEFDLSDLPLVLGPFDYEPGVNPNLVVWGPGLACVEDIAVLPNCNDNCEEFVVNILDFTCQGPFETFLFFQVTAPFPDGTFRVFRDGELLEEYTYEDQIYQLHLISVAPVFSLLFVDDETGCSYAIDVDNPCQSACEILALNAVTTCDNGFAFLTFDFEYVGNQSDEFFYTVDGLTGSFTLGELPLTIGPLDGTSPTTNTLLVFPANDQCEAIATFTQDCGDVCESFAVDIFQTECSGQDGTIIHFAALPPTSGEFFRVFANGDLVSEFLYDQSIHSVILSSDEPLYFLEFVDDLTGCTEAFDLINPCFPHECEIENLVTNPLDCIDGVYYIEVDFTYTGLVTEGLSWFANGETGTFSIEELPLLIGPFDHQGSVNVVVVGPIGQCANETIFEVDCATSCEFSDVFAEASPCDGDQFLIDFEFFSTQNTGTFFAFVNGNLFGPFVYGQPFYTVGPFAAGQNSYDLTLIDTADPSCFGFYSLAAPICNDECHIYDIVATPTDCTDEAFFVTIDFDAINTGNSFTIVGNGNNYGTFGYNELPLTLGPFAADGETEYEFGVIDLTDPTCFNFTSLSPQSCFACVVYEMEYTVDCEGGDDLMATLQVFVDHEFDPNDAFVLYLGEIPLGEFSFGQLPLSLTRDLPLLSEGDYLRLEIPGTDCEFAIDYALPCCHFSWGDEDVIASECEADGAFFAILDLVDPPFNGSDSVDITYGPTIGGTVATTTVAYSDFPVEVGPLPGNGESDHYFLLSDQNQECTATATLEAVSCNIGACVEFDGLTQHFYGPNTGYDDGDLIDEEDNISITYKDHPASDCDCYVFGFAAGGVPAFINASGLTAMTDRSGIGLAFDELGGVDELTIDYYFAGQSFSLAVNGSDLIEINQATDTDIEIVPGIIFSYSAQASGDGTTGTIYLSGDLIETLALYSIGIAVFDNVCHSGAEPEEPFSDCLDFAPLLNGIDSALFVLDAGQTEQFAYEESGVNLLTQPTIDFGVDVNGQFTLLTNDECGIGAPAIRTGRNIAFDYSDVGGIGRMEFNFQIGNLSTINLRVNDGQLWVANQFSLIPTDIAPGVTLTVQLNDPTNPRRGRLILEGDMNEVIVGGTQLCLAEICWFGPFDEVWPGDVNTNNIADLYDLLHIGVAFAAEGPARTNSSPNWEAQAASDWEHVFADGNNFKHADTDGNGIVNENDVDILELNYGLEHGPVEAFVSPPATDADPPIFLDLSDIGTPQVGSQVVIPIVLGTEEVPVEDIYGIAFQLSFATESFQLSSLSLEIPTSWLGEPGVNLLHLDRADPEQNVWNISLVRNDHNNVSGYGPVAYLRGIIDDIAGIADDPINFDIHSTLAIESSGYPIPVHRIGGSFLVTNTTDKNPNDIRFMPNPTSGDLFVRGPVEDIPPFVKIFAADSRFLGNFAINNGRLDLNRLPSGVYFLEVNRGVLRTIQRVVITR